MIRSRTLLSVVLLLLVLGVVQMAMYYPRMPSRMASHFGADGRPDGWTSRSAFFTAMLATHLGTGGLLLAIGFAVHRIPMRLMNMPRKDYWGHPDREAATREFIHRRMLWFACATVAFFNVITWLCCQANLRADQSMGRWPIAVVGLYVAFTLGWSAHLLWRFVRVPQ